MTGSDKVNILLFIIVFLTSCSKLNSLFKKKFQAEFYSLMKTFTTQ